MVCKEKTMNDDFDDAGDFCYYESEEFPRTLETKVRNGTTFGRAPFVKDPQVYRLVDRIETSPSYTMGDGAEDAFSLAMDEMCGDNY
jgi:hypothetical protein